MATTKIGWAGVTKPTNPNHKGLQMVLKTKGKVILMHLGFI